MASYNAQIDLDVRIEKAFANINKLERRITQIGQTPINIERGITREVNSAIQSFERLGRIVRGTGVAIAGLGGAGALGTLVSTLSALTRQDFGALGAASKAVVGLDNALLNLAGNAPLATAGIAATTAAALAFAPQIARAATDTIRLGKALGFAKGPLRALGEALGTASAEGPMSSMSMAFGDLTEAVQAYRKALYESSESVSELQRRQNSLQSTLNNFNSSSETAEKIARKLVEVNQRLNDELREQADLIRSAKGVNVTELEATKGRKSIDTKQRAEEFRSKQLREEQTIKQALEKLDQRGISALEQKLNIQRNIVNSLSQEASYTKSAAGKEFDRRAAQAKAVSLEIQNQVNAMRVLDKSSAKVVFNKNLQVELARRIVQLNAEDIEQYQRRLANQAKLNQMLAEGNRIRASYAKEGTGNEGRGGFGRGGNILVGAAFPALFGAGPAGIVGGGVGEAFGPLGGVVGSALGNIVDEYASATTALAESLSKPKEALEALEEAGYPVSDSIKRTVEKLLESGKAYEAQQLIFEEIKKTLGPDAVKQLTAYNIENEKLKKKFQEIKAELDKALLPALTGALKVFSALIGGIKRLSEVKLPDWAKNAIKASVAMMPGGAAFGLQGKFIFDQLSGAGRKLAAAAPAPPAAEQDPEYLARIEKEQLRQQEKREKIRAKNAELELKFEQEVLQYRNQHVQLLDRELALRKMTSQEDKYTRASLEAQLNVDKQRLELKKALEATARAGTDAGARISATKDVFAAQDALKRAEAEAAVAREAERVYNMYTKQADALNQVVVAGKMRLAQDTAALEGQQKIDQAYYQAALALNNVELQRARQAGDVQKIRQLEIAQANIIYNQTIAAIRAEVERVKLKQRQVALATKESEVALYRAAAEGKNIDAYREAYNLQLQALKIANYNVEVQAKVANYQTQTAKATNEAAVAAANFAASQQQAAAAARSTAASTQTTSSLSRDATKRAYVTTNRYGTSTRGPGGFLAIGGSGNLAVNQYARQFLEATDMSKDAYSAARERQDLALRRLARKQSYERYKQEAAELASVGIYAPSNPYSDYRSITAYAPGRGSYSIGGSRTVFGALFAEGGYVTSPTKALVGERGENEYVIPESKMQSSMARYARGARGEAVVQGNGSDNGMGRRTARGTTTVNVSTGPVVRMGNKDYVTVADLNNAVGSVVATLSRDTSNKYGTNPRIS